ncbi:protein-disulfide reductase DsbD family protein [bacterium]|nr:protein-disulfide reductase DsbD family protein [bacterium]
MIFKVLIHLLVWFILFTGSTFSSLKTTYTDVTIFSDNNHVAPGQKAHLNIRLNHKNGWYSYWINPGDSGLATNIKWQTPKGIKAESIIWPGPTRHSLGPLINFGYKEKAELIIPINISSDINTGTYALQGTLSWLVCKDVCIPEQVDFNYPISVKQSTQASVHFESIHALLKKRNWPVLTGVFELTKQTIQIKLIHNQDIQTKPLYFFPIQTNIIAYQNQQIFDFQKQRLTIMLPRNPANTDTFKNITGLLKLNEHDYIYIKATNKDHTSIVNNALLRFIALAFLGGLLLNIMPCVFPILSLKVLSILKKSKTEQKQVQNQSLAYTAGVWTMFMLLVGLIELFKYAGYQAGWGFQLQEPLFISCLFIVMIAVGLYFNQRLPIPDFINTIPGKLGSLHYKATQHNIYGDFFTGLLAVIIATPCTAPFMAVAIGFALTQSFLDMAFIFTALSIGFASPFLIIAYVPRFQMLLPKPGQWMQTVTHILAIPIYITGLWLAWILSKQIGNQAWVYCSTLTIAILMYSSASLSQKKWLKWTSIILIIAALLAMTKLEKINLETTNKKTFESLAKYQETKNAIFVDVTADWCLSCKVNERLVLFTPEIQRFFKNQKIEFLTLDWTQADPSVTRYLKSFDRQGVPLYVYYNQQGEITLLPELLTKKHIFQLKERSSE